MSVPWVGMSTPNPESQLVIQVTISDTECSTELKKCFPEFQVLQQEIEFFDTNVFVLVHVLVSADFKLLLHSPCILSLALRTILMSKIYHKLLLTHKGSGIAFEYILQMTLQPSDLSLTANKRFLHAPNADLRGSL